MRREIAALKKETGGVADAGERSKQLTRLHAELATARERYSDDHPDIVKLRKSIAALEAEQLDSGDVRTTAVKPENPAYIALQAQLQSALSEIKSSRTKRAALQAKVASYERRLEQTPQVEREYLDLSRDREASWTRYREIKAKQMQADIGQELEKDRKGERFSLIDPPQLPEQPSSPNRPAILLLGLVLSLGAGVGCAAILEGLDDSVHGAKTLTAIVKVPVLAVIPYIENEGERRKKLKLRRIAAASSLAALVLVAILINSFFVPLDVLWFRGLQKLQMYAPGGMTISESPLEILGTIWNA